MNRSGETDAVQIGGNDSQWAIRCSNVWRGYLHTPTLCPEKWRAVCHQLSARASWMPGHTAVPGTLAHSPIGAALLSGLSSVTTLGCAVGYHPAVCSVQDCYIRPEKMGAPMNRSGETDAVQIGGNDSQKMGLPPAMRAPKAPSQAVRGKMPHHPSV